MSDATEDRAIADERWSNDDEEAIDNLRQWRDEWADAKLRYKVQPAGEAAIWEGVDAALRELDRCIDPDDLDDEQTAVYEAGYVAGQDAVATQLHQFARRIERTNRDLG